jgi:hypothetical protein
MKVAVDTVDEAVQVCLALPVGAKVEIDFGDEVGPELIGTLEGELRQYGGVSFKFNGHDVERTS